MTLRFLLQPFAALLVPLIAYALSKSEQAWLRPLLNALAAGLAKVWFVGDTLAHGVLHVEAAVRHYLGNQVLAMEQPAVRWILALRTFVAQLVYVLSNTTIATARAVEILADDVIAKLEVPVRVTLPGVKTRVRVLDKKSVAAIAAAVAAITALKHTATVTMPGAIAGDIADLRDYVNRKANTLAKAISHVEKQAAVGALAAGVTWAAIRRLKLGWLRCGGVNRVGRSLCGMTGLIEALYAGAITAFAVSDLCRFAYGIERAAEGIRPVMLAWVDVENALLRCSSASFPKPLPLAKVSATPVIDAVAL